MGLYHRSANFREAGKPDGSIGLFSSFFCHSRYKLSKTVDLRCIRKNTFKYYGIHALSMEETMNLRAYPGDIKRLKKYGQSGDSLAVALHKLLDRAEKVPE